MFGSSQRAAPARKPINFVKTVSSPRQADPARAPPVVLHLEVNFEGKARRLSFPHSPTTSTIGELVRFLEESLGVAPLCLRTARPTFDYLLTLRAQKVGCLGVKRLEVWADRVRMGQGRLLLTFEVVRCIGTGGFSRVYLARGWGQLVALKVISKQYILDNDKRSIVENERVILQRCRGHPFVTQLFASFETNEYLVFAMEYCHGGELFNLLRRVRRMDEDQARFYFLETLAALQHLHDQKILYRDLKPENIIIDEEGHLRLADYGLSKIMEQGRTHSFCGSAEYMAPEMLLKKGHSFEIDYYCLGALLYELVTGLPPYYSRHQKELFDNILNMPLEFPQQPPLSKNLRKMLTRLLEKDTDLRFQRISDILAHPWLAEVDFDQVVNKQLEPPFKTDLFADNFDDSDFAADEELELGKFNKDREQALAPSDAQFKNFSYVCPEWEVLERRANEEKQARLDFSRKPTHATVDHPVSLNRSGSIRSGQVVLDQSVGDHQQLSPRNMAYPLAHSQDKYKVAGSGPAQSIYNSLTPSSSVISTGLHSGQPSTLSHSGSGLHKHLSSQLTGVRSVPQLFKAASSKDTSLTQQHAKSPYHHSPYARPLLRSPSPAQPKETPININNYINIYTNKQPLSFNPHFHRKPSNPHSGQNRSLNFKTPPPHPPKTLNSSSKDVLHSSHKDLSHLALHTHAQRPTERTKFSSLDRPQAHPPHYNYQAPSFLQNNVYYGGGGQTGSFKDRSSNGGPRIKKGHKTQEKFSFNTALGSQHRR